MNDSAGTPLPMNSTSLHPKLKVSLSFVDRFVIAGDNVCGALEMECRGEAGERGKEVGIGSMMVEMWGVEELLSRDHTAKAPFLYCRRVFQGPGLPPSNAVYPHPLPNSQPLPAHYHLGKRGQSSFNFRMPLPETSPSSISFCQAARVRYEVRASVQVVWKGEKKVVVHSKEVNVVENYPDVDFGRHEPEAVAVGENGKIWMQGKLIGGVLVAGESACVELQVKNHSTRKNSSLSLALTRTLHINNASDALLISDTLTTVPFRGQEYIIPPAAEGVASLVFDVPRLARSVRGGRLQGLEEKGAQGTEALFHIQAAISVKMDMGIGRTDIVVDIPVTIVHPAVLPELPPPTYPQEYFDPRAQSPYEPHTANPYRSPSPYYQQPYPPMSPPLAYVDPNQHYVWLPPPNQPYFSPPAGQPYYYPQPPPPHPYAQEAVQMRDHSVSPQSPPQLSQPNYAPPPLPSGLPPPSLPAMNPLPPSSSHPAPLKIDLQNLAPQNLYPHPLSPQGQGQNIVYSPRPFLSPKLSPSADPMHNSLGRSERVEELERMADEVVKQATKNDIPPAEHVVLAALDKTLPGPPVPSGKVSITQSRPRADVYFSQEPAPSQQKTTPRASPRPSPHPSPRTSPLHSPTQEKMHSTNAEAHLSPSKEALQLPVESSDSLPNGPQTPPTPTLTGISRLSAKKPSPSLAVPAAGSESGLDALEKRLLAEVGTRKIRHEPPPPSVMALGLSGSSAIDIPSPRSKDSKEEGDSAISSLSLGAEEEEKEWDERTHRGGSKAKASDPGRGDLETKTQSEGKTKRNAGGMNGKSKRKIEQAKGRVAEWLGAVSDPTPDVQDVVSGLPSPRLEESVWDIPPSRVVQKQEEEATKDSTPTATVAGDSKTESVEDTEPLPNPRSSGFMPMGTFKRDAYTRTLVPKNANPWADEPPTKDVHSPLPDQTNPWKMQKKLTNLPKFPPPPKDAEAKYDVRSARGGRGGKVTAVAAIWATGAAEKPDARTPKPPAVKPSKPPMNPHKLGKTPVASSVAVSSSHARPILSSTASLARPAVSKATSGPTSKGGWRPAMTTLSEATKDNASAPKSARGEPGKAKIKDLIKKYQQQPAL